MPPLFPSWSDVHRLDVKLDALLHQSGIELSREAFIIQQEHSIMTTAQDLDDQSKQLLAKANAEGDAVTAIAGVVADIKAQNTTLLQELADANASGNQAAIDEAMANLQAANAKLDANAIAEAAINGTTPPAETPVTPPATPPNPPASGAGPTIVSITPDTGHAAGGDSVMINGTGFSTVSGVTFGGVPAPSVAPDHDSSLTVVTPPGSGTVDVVVSNAGGDSAALPFTYA